MEWYHWLLILISAILIYMKGVAVGRRPTPWYRLEEKTRYRVHAITIIHGKTIAIITECKRCDGKPWMIRLPNGQLQILTRGDAFTIGLTDKKVWGVIRSNTEDYEITHDTNTSPN